jgi:molecular chaperone DnaK
MPQVEVTFDIDANGILNVTAKDKATSKEQKITITASTKLSDTEKDRMVREAERFAEQDRKRREEAELRNAADTLLYTADKTKRDLKDKLTAEQTGRIDAAATALREAVAAKDIDKIKAQSEELSRVLQEIGAAAYKEAARAQAPEKEAEAPPGAPPKEKVVDADYRVVDDEKKS